MRLVNRKTLPVCKEHHKLIHADKYNGISLSNLFESFKKNGVGFNKDKAFASEKSENIRCYLELTGELCEGKLSR